MIRLVLSGLISTYHAWRAHRLTTRANAAAEAGDESAACNLRLRVARHERAADPSRPIGEGVPQAARPPN